ncbi:MAG: hypothetical protein Q8L37_02040 [Candidatus Gottesmanbacteria bacterium]|nr:hypothetical protein [Candidatus Gottesmanbacteria bacterium]
MRNIIIIFIASMMYIGSVFLVSQGKTFRLDSDYDSNIPIFSYVVDTIRTEHRFPDWNPYVTTGISVLGDPLSGVTYLPYLLPMLIFGVQSGWWAVLGLHAFMAGVFMWMCVREILMIKPSFQRAKLGFDLALWGGLLYMGAGAFAARVAAGHIEKVLSYPWYPLFLLFILKKEQTSRTRLLTGAVMGLVFLTGDVYGVFFMGMFYGVVRVISSTSSRWAGLRGVKEIGITIVAFMAVASVKLIPFILQVVPVISRYSNFDAAKGSLHLFFAWIPFVMPFGVTFYDRTQLQHIFGFWYNWYEYYAFIGFPIFFLIALPKIIKRREVQLLIILLVVGIMYVARGYPYSIFYWMDRSLPVLNWFRAPQRMYEALTSVVVALITLCASNFLRPPLALRQAQGKQQGVAFKNIVFLWGMLGITFFASGYQMTYAVEIPRAAEENLVQQLRTGDGGDITVATFACCMQTFLVAGKIRVINYYYGWLPYDAPRFVNASADGFDFSALDSRLRGNDILKHPTYIIAPKDMMFGQYGYEVWFGDEINSVWRVSILS